MLPCVKDSPEFPPLHYSKTLIFMPFRLMQTKHSDTCTSYTENEIQNATHIFQSALSFHNCPN